MIVGAVAIVGGDRIAQEAGEPDAEIAHVDGHDDVALVHDGVAQRRQRIAPLSEDRIVDQPLLGADRTAVEGHATEAARRRLTIGALAGDEQHRARTIGSRHDMFS